MQLSSDEHFHSKRLFVVDFFQLLKLAAFCLDIFRHLLAPREIQLLLIEFSHAQIQRVQSVNGQRTIRIRVPPHPVHSRVVDREQL